MLVSENADGAAITPGAPISTDQPEAERLAQCLLSLRTVVATDLVVVQSVTLASLPSTSTRRAEFDDLYHRFRLAAIMCPQAPDRP